ncbi:MAG TPA: SDR family oxidoreductase [Chitinophagaceae bacterium]|nr:SDR family oxidoreductase [Chitinophagaceae bacterium]
MKVLLTGANGFLGYYLTGQLLSKGYDVIATGKGKCRLTYDSMKNFIYIPMDFTNPFVVHDVFEKFNPEVVIHAGAISKVDECEQHQWQAYQANVAGTLNLLMNAAGQKCFFVFISTDFIFDGQKGMYTEEDAGSPVNFYGKTKLEAEEAVKEYEYDWAIVRTILVYGKPITGKGNILSIVKEKLEKGEEYQVVSDQLRTPTYVEDLANGIITLTEKNATGIYHIGGEDVLTPYDMACLTADYLNLDKSLIKEVTAINFSQPAKRPLKTGLKISKAKKELNYQPVSFQEGLRKTFG